MRLYSDFPLRRAAQLVADLVAVAVVVAAIWLAVLVHGVIAGLAGVGRQLERAGRDFQGTMSDAGRRLGDVPLVGAGIRKPFDAASGAGSTLADAGQSQQDLVATSATVIAVLIAVIPILAVAWVWARRRARFVLRASAAARIARLADGDDVLALRALGTASARELERIAARPVAAWRAGDPAVVGALAALELREAGVRRRAASAR